MKNDRQLVSEHLHGRGSALAELFDRRNPDLYAFAFHLSASPDDAADLCQHTWLQAIRSLASYQGRASFRAWLHGIALNLHRQARRKRSPQFVPLAEDLPDPTWDPQAALERRDRFRALRAALNRLAATHREVLILHEIQGFKYREIARILECPIGTVKSRLHHAFAALRAALAETAFPKEETDALPSCSPQPEGLP